mgnify:CR=1 FL=1
MIKFLAHSLLVLLFFLSKAYSVEEQPNIVILYADDLGMGDLGSFTINSGKHSKIPTPNLDKLAAQGVTSLGSYLLMIKFRCQRVGQMLIPHRTILFH